MTRAALAAAIAAILAAPPALRAQPSGPPAARVVVDAVREEVLEARREVRGELRATQRSLIASEEPGRVVELSVEEGDRVEKGQAIARLDDTLLRLDADRAASEVDRREAVLRERAAQLQKAERDIARVEQLTRESSASQNELEDRRTLLEEARARLAQADAELAAARTEAARLYERLADMVVEAPFAGRVVTKRTEVGQWVAEGAAVAELAALDDVDAWLSVPQTYIAAVSRDGLKLQLRIEATGETVEAPVAAVVPVAGDASRAFPVRVRLPNGDGRYKPGMSVVGFVPTGSREPALTVHKDAVLRDDAGLYVYFNAGGTAMVSRVEQLFAAGERIAVRAPQLRAGVQVVVEGNERLFPGQPLTIQPAPGRAAPATPPAQER